MTLPLIINDPWATILGLAILVGAVAWLVCLWQALFGVEDE